MYNLIKQMRELQLKKVVQSILSLEFQRDIIPEFWLITITWIKISSDFSYTDVYVSCFPANKDLLNYLNSRLWHFQHILNQKIERRKVPKLRFKYDDSGEFLEVLSKL